MSSSLAAPAKFNMDNATTRSRKIPSRLVVILLAIVGIFFIIFLITRNPINDSSTTSKSGLPTLELPQKTDLPEISDVANIEETTAKVVYLTFDDGPGPYTAELLDILKKYNVKATFFVTKAGSDALIAREFNEGHTVGLHSYTHDYTYIYASVGNFFEDLYNIQGRVKNITGETSTIIRFPGGSSNLVSAKYDGGAHIMSTLVPEATARGFTYFDWNVSSGDAGAPISSDQVYENTINNLKPEFSVVLQHDTKDYSVNAVERIINHGLKNGYTFKRLEKDSFSAHHGINN